MVNYNLFSVFGAEAVLVCDIVFGVLRMGVLAKSVVRKCGEDDHILKCDRENLHSESECNLDINILGYFIVVFGLRLEVCSVRW
jgi:hypothetical protein